MQTYISILRGINVSGHKMMKMEALNALFAELGFKNIKTYIQSGNVVFQFKETPTDVLEKKIAKKIIEAFFFEVPVIVKKFIEVETILINNPFLNSRKEDPKLLHLTFLAAKPEEAELDKIKRGNYGADEFIVTDKSIYLFCPEGYGNTKLSNNFFERKLKLTATTRNWKTLNELVKIAKEMA
ncbi:MAG: DUF1697 domain-containing protein [Bacteroidia bacterium]|nr:DUF1697 domain-containing protein [Bacteroidia bacterium]